MKQNFNIPNSSTRKFHFTSWNSFTINSPIFIHLKLWAEHTRKRGRLKLDHIQMEDRDSHGHSWCTRSMPQIMKIIRYNHFLLPFNSISYNRMLYLLIFTQLFGLAACSCCCILCRICEHLLVGLGIKLSVLIPVPYYIVLIHMIHRRVWTTGIILYQTL